MFMKKVWLVLALIVGMSPMLHAGSLTNAPFGKGAGNELLDATGKQSVKETYQRGMTWGAPATLTSLSTTSSATAVTLTGASTNYVGPYWVKITPIDSNATDVVGAAYGTVTAVTSPLAPVGDVVKAGTSFVAGPFTKGQFYHFRGRTTTAATGYQIGWNE